MFVLAIHAKPETLGRRLVETEATNLVPSVFSVFNFSYFDLFPYAALADPINGTHNKPCFHCPAVFTEGRFEIWKLLTINFGDEVDSFLWISDQVASRTESTVRGGGVKHICVRARVSSSRRSLILISVEMQPRSQGVCFGNPFTKFRLRLVLISHRRSI